MTDFRNVLVGDIVQHGTGARGLVIESTPDVSEFTGKPVTRIEVIWMNSRRRGSFDAQVGCVRKFTLNEYGVGDVSKVADGDDGPGFWRLVAVLESYAA